MAIVVLNAGEDAGAEDLITFARSGWRRYKCPTNVEFTDVPAPQPQRQDPQEGPSRPVLGGPHPPGQLVVSTSSFARFARSLRSVELVDSALNLGRRASNRPFAAGEGATAPPAPPTESYRDTTRDRANVSGQCSRRIATLAAVGFRGGFVITALGPWRIGYLIVAKADQPLLLNDSIYFSIQAGLNSEGHWFEER